MTVVSGRVVAWEGSVSAPETVAVLTTGPAVVGRRLVTVHRAGVQTAQVGRQVAGRLRHRALAGGS